MTINDEYLWRIDRIQAKTKTTTTITEEEEEKKEEQNLKRLIEEVKIYNTNTHIFTLSLLAALFLFFSFLFHLLTLVKFGNDIFFLSDKE
jgi:hypothetical protein